MRLNDLKQEFKGNIVEIKCKYCGNNIPFKLKLAAEDFEDEHWNEVENQQGGTISDKVYNRKRDPLDWKIYYQEDTYRKNYPGETHKLKPDHDVGVSNVAIKSGNQILVKCGKCKQIYAGVFDPSGMDTYHNDNYRNQPETSPTSYQNEIHPNFDRGVSNVDKDVVDINQLVQKVKKYKKEHKNEVQ